MRKKTAAPLLLAVMVGCEVYPTDLDLGGLDAFGDFGGGGGAGWSIPDPTTVSVSGSVAVGRYPALGGEVTIELFDPADLSTPVAVSGSANGQYHFDLGAPPRPAVCGYVVRAVLWTGTTTAMQPLLDPVPARCGLEPSWMGATTLTLPEYEPLPEPFALEGDVFVDGRPAFAQEATFEVQGRSESGSPTTSSVMTQADGRYRFETRDAAQRFALCSEVHGHARDSSGRTEWLYLGIVPLADCGNLRTLPDTRLGTLKAAVGFVFLGDPSMDRRVGAGEAWVELLSLDDGTAQGERFETLDDGSFHVWFPHHVRERQCDWLLRITHESGSSEVRRAFEDGMCRAETLYPHFVGLEPGPAAVADVLELVVADPISDNTGPTDLTGMNLRFDATTGVYELVLTATADRPFQDSLRVNVNLYNPSRRSFFNDTMNDVRIETPTTTLTLRGLHAALRSWLPGDAVYTNSLRGTPNPVDATLFRSGVSHFPMGFLTNEDVLAFEDWAEPAVVVRVEG